MNYVGIDLHKKTIVLCAMDQDLRVLRRRTFACSDPEAIGAFFAALGAFRAVVEATAGYEWLVALIEPLAERVVLAHPGKLRVVAESTKKTDRLDAQVLAEFLARGQIPEAFRPSCRQREHRALVRHRQYLKQQVTAMFLQMERDGAIVPSTDGKDPSFKVDVYSTQADFDNGIVRIDIAMRPVRAIDYIYATILVQN